MFSKAFTKKTIIFYLFLILLSQFAFKAPSVKAYGGLANIAQGPVANNSSSYVRCAPNSQSLSIHRGGCVHPNYPDHSSSSYLTSLIRQVLQIIAAVIDLFVNSLFGNSNHGYHGYDSGNWYGSNYDYGQQIYSYQPTYNHGYQQHYPDGGYGSGQHGYGYQHPYYGNSGYTNAGYHPIYTNNGNSSGDFWPTALGSFAGTIIGQGLFGNSGSTTNNNYTSNNYDITQIQQIQSNLFAQQNNTNLAYNQAPQYDYDYPVVIDPPTPLWGSTTTTPTNYPVAIDPPTPLWGSPTTIPTEYPVAIDPPTPLW